MFVHEDARRFVYDWAQGEFKAAKAVIAKGPCAVGCHYHRNKDESFLLIHGFCDLSIVGEQRLGQVAAPHLWHVPRGTYHEFHLQAGAILMGVATEEFDEADEIRGKPVDLEIAIA